MLIDLAIENYKSLKRVGLRLRPFQLLVGPNGAGKSNFVDCFDFLSLVFRHGLSTAVSSLGGYENIAFRQTRRSKGGIKISFRVEREVDLQRFSSDSFEPFQAAYDYSFAFQAKGQAIASDYAVTQERLRIYAIEKGGGEIGIADVERDGMSVRSYLGRDQALAPILGRFTKYLEDSARWGDVPAEVAPDELFVSSISFPLAMFVQPLTNFMEHIRVFQVAPTEARRSASPSPRAELGRHGENLPAVLSWLKREHPDAFASLVNELRRAVPTMRGIDIDYTDTKQLGIFFHEDRVGRRWFVTDVSDGTLQTVALYVPLLDPRPTFVLIEEPENSVHPWVLRDFIDTARSRAQERQILLTTHSPIAVSRVSLEDLLLVERRAGHTEIRPASLTYPMAKAIVSEGFANLGEYWDSGQMRAVPGEYDPDISYEDDE